MSSNTVRAIAKVIRTNIPVAKMAGHLEGNIRKYTVNFYFCHYLDYITSNGTMIHE
jgi:hypothetical protein